MRPLFQPPPCANYQSSARSGRGLRENPHDGVAFAQLWEWLLFRGELWRACAGRHESLPEGFSAHRTAATVSSEPLSRKMYTDGLLCSQTAARFAVRQ